MAPKHRAGTVFCAMGRLDSWFGFVNFGFASVLRCPFWFCFGLRSCTLDLLWFFHCEIGFALDFALDLLQICSQNQ